MNWYAHVQDTLVAETYACRDGIRLAEVTWVPKVALETDSQALGGFWDNRHASCSYIDAIMISSYCFVRKTTNTVAHACAQQATSSSSRCLWDVFPSFLSCFILMIVIRLWICNKVFLRVNCIVRSGRLPIREAHATANISPCKICAGQKFLTMNIWKNYV